MVRKFVYLGVLLCLLIGGIIFLREYHQASLVVDLTGRITKNKKSSIVSEYLAGTVAEKKGDYDSAINYFEKALVFEPDNAEMISRLYGLYLFNGDYEKAIIHAKRQYELDKENNTPANQRNPIGYLLIALDEFNKKETKEIPEILEPLIDPKIPDRTHLDGVVIPMVLAWSYVVDERYRDSFRIIDGITSQYMLSVFSYNRAVINDLANNKNVLVDGKNLSQYEKARKYLSEVFFEIGQYSLQNANLEEAIVYLRLARFVDPDSYKFKKTLAVIYEAMDKLPEAIEIYQQIPQTSEFYPETLMNIALAYHMLKNDEKAIETLEKVREIKGYAYQADFGIGTIKMGDNDFAEAVKYFEKAEKELKVPTREQWNLYFNLGVAYDKLGDWVKAEPYFKKSVKLFPENPESLNYLAYSWLVRNQNIKQARAMLEAAVIRSGGAPHILDSYGWALYKMSFYKEALPFMEQAAVALPASSVINDHLGDVYWKLDRKREAKFQWKKALEAYDDDKDVSAEITKESIEKKIDSGLE